jgi:hypothetical protein
VTGALAGSVTALLCPLFPPSRRVSSSPLFGLLSSTTLDVDDLVFSNFDPALAFVRPIGRLRGSSVEDSAATPAILVDVAFFAVFGCPRVHSRPSSAEPCPSSCANGLEAAVT